MRRKHHSPDIPSEQTTRVQAGLQPMLTEERFRLTRLDWILGSVVAFLAALWTFFHIGTSLNWDDMLYMGLSQYTRPEAWILNRYGHIYLQKFFFFLCQDAITGGKVFWCFIFFSTALLTYWCTRILVGKKSVFIAVIAVLLFLMHPMFAREAGSTLCDFTATFLTMLAVFVYLYFLNGRDKYTPLFIALLGLLFFWAVKSKEIGICVLPLFLGLGRDENDSWKTIRWLRDFGWACVGIIAGCVILMLLDAAFLRDAFFSIRPSNITQVLSTNVGEPAELNVQRTILSWFAYFTTQPLFPLFILYLLAGWKSPCRQFSVREKMIWAIPLFLIVFLTYSRRGWYVVPRYFMPAIPVCCIWAAQFFHFKFRSPTSLSNKHNTNATAVRICLVAFAFLIVSILFVPQIESLLRYYKMDSSFPGFPNILWDPLTDRQLLYMLVITPFALAGLLITSVISNKRGLWALFFSFLFLFALTLPPLWENISRLAIGKEVVMRTQIRLLPLKTFGDQLALDKNTKIFVSEDMHLRTWALGYTAEANSDIFNVYFNSKLDYGQFTFGKLEDILKDKCAYAFTTAGELQTAAAQPVLKEYTVTTDPSIYTLRGRQVQFALLKKR